MKFFIHPFGIYNVKYLEKVSYEPDEERIYFVFKSSSCYVNVDYGRILLDRIQLFLRNSNQFFDIYEERTKISEEQQNEQIEQFTHFTP